MNDYQLFGLVFQSALEFSELPKIQNGGAGDSGVRLTLESVTTPRPADGEGEHWFGVQGHEAWFDWQGVARVHIADGRTIRLDPADGVDEAGLRSAILGPAFSVLLAQRGLYPLHASSVTIGARVAAFAGAAGAGKSTLALAFQEEGHAFRSDDVSAIEVFPGTEAATRAVTETARESEGGLLCFPAYPQCKLTPELYEHRGEDWRSKPRANPEDEKRAHPMEPAGSQAGLPLDAVYLLEDGELEVSERLSASEALFETIRHVHRPSLMEQVMTHEGLLKRAAAVAAGVPFYRLRRPRTLDGLSDVVACVVEHLAR